MRQTIDAAAFQQMVIHAAAAISVEKQQVNDLNVFPVPDGRHGHHMSLTIAAAAGEMKKKSYDTVGQAAQATASALLRGARGTRALFCPAVPGLRQGHQGPGDHGRRDLAIALDFGVAAAYKAVMKPAEGTILTVSRMAAARAAGTAREDNCAEAVLAAAIEEGQAALADTVNQNPVLKKAGVVDAAARASSSSSRHAGPAPGQAHARAERGGARGGEGRLRRPVRRGDHLRLDTVFIVRKPSPHVNLEPFRTYLNGIGDSLVIGEDDEAFKVHVHTNIPGPPSPRPRSTALWSWPRSRTCAPSGGPGPPGGMSRVPTTWRPWRRSWRTGLRPGRAGEGRPREGVRLRGRVRRRGAGGRVPGTWGWTGSSPGDRP